MLDNLPRHGNITILPVLHYQMEFADAARLALRQLRPGAVVVELPPTLEPQVRLAVRRLPELSVIVYLSELGLPVYLPVEPCDAFIEAVRSGLEQDIPVVFGDVDVDEFPLYEEAFPDAYAVARLGIAPYYAAWRAADPIPARTSDDIRREANLAWHAQTLAAEHDSVLVVCGMAHTPGILAALDEPQAQQMQRISRQQVNVFNLHPDSARSVMGVTPFVSAIYERRRLAVPEPLPTPKVITTRHASGLTLVSSGLETTRQQADRRARVQVNLASAAGEVDQPLDRQRLLLGLVQAAREAYEVQTGEHLGLSYVRTWLQFVRNYALLEGALLPDLYQLIVGARGVADDNLAHEVWDLGSWWPWQQEWSVLPTVEMTPDEMWLGSRRFALRPRVQRRKMRLHAVSKRERRSEKRAGEWRREFADGWGICSYPPEDVAIEEFGRHLHRRAKHQLAEDDARVEKFTTSTLDGIDVRETVRNWFEKTLYVKELRRIRGEVGGVVVIFDEDHDERYPWRMTWLGEHDQESDMAFYATDPGRQIVGPGIARCEYGGFAMSYPPGRMMDVWEDPDYRGGLTKPEVLLMAALDYSLDKHVVYVAAKPPRSHFQTWAGRLGRQICYLPLGGLSPVTLKKLRVFHVLSDHDKRELAGEYIW
ncbi:MAG: hypothetical protein HZB16_15065 [Armatimonadetes bacterium]|nr:hypothetical protein [Armatimonadota bacterium]